MNKDDFGSIFVDGKLLNLSSVTSEDIKSYISKNNETINTEVESIKKLLSALQDEV